MTIAYLRISTNRQHLENQRDEIERFAASRGITVDKMYNDIVSGKKNSKERKLGDILKRMKSGDTLIVTEISRLSRTLIDIMNIIHQCIEREITLHSTKEGYTFENNLNSKILGFAFGLVAEIERNLISARTKEALALRKANGMILGRPIGSAPKQKILVENQEILLHLVGQGTPYKRIAKKMGGLDMYDQPLYEGTPRPGRSMRPTLLTGKLLMKVFRVVIDSLFPNQQATRKTFKKPLTTPPYRFIRTRKQSTQKWAPNGKQTLHGNSHSAHTYATAEWYPAYCYIRRSPH